MNLSGNGAGQAMAFTAHFVRIMSRRESFMQRLGVHA